LIGIILCKPSLLIRYWNIWIGILFLAAAVWGLASFFAAGEGTLKQATLGGTIGANISGDAGTVGGLRVFGLAFIGIIFIIPKIIGYIWKGMGFVFASVKSFFSSNNQPRPKPEPSPVTKPVPAPDPVQPQSIETPANMKPILTAGGWQLPPMSTLDKSVDLEVSKADVETQQKLLQNALASYGVDVEVTRANIGPTVTQFEVEPGWDRKFKEIKEKDKDGNVKISKKEIGKTRVKVERINSLSNDLALALAAPSIRIEAPIPGKSAVGIEVPNLTFASVNLRSIMESDVYKKFSVKPLSITLGKGTGGETSVADLAKMPHLLVAGATGSGKSVFLNAAICCLLMKHTPDEVRFIMIDPKRVELVIYNNLPHLEKSHVVVEPQEAVAALRWLTQEMDSRYKTFAKAGVRNIEGYNQERQGSDKMPYIVLIIDEVADLMMTASDEVERTICRLAQLARATGIHLIVATQRPSVDVITGLIKANFPTRISFALTSQVDSRTILDAVGAEKLLGRGDMLFMATDAIKPKRLQGPFVTDAEIERIVYFWGKQKRPGEVATSFEEGEQTSLPIRKDPDDPLIVAARQLAHDHLELSASYLQRRLHIGFPRAARLMEELEAEGLVEKGQKEEEGLP